MHIGREAMSVVVDAAVQLSVRRQDARLQHIAEFIDVQRAP